MKKINNIRSASYKFVRKTEIIQEKFPNKTSVQRFRIPLRGVNPRSSGYIALRKMSTTSRRRSQSVGNNDKQRFRITEQRV
jgi:hypothetical protein